MAGRFLKLHDCLANDPLLTPAFPEARRLQILERTLGVRLSGCRVARAEGEILYIECPNGALATRVRSQATSLLDLAVRAGFALHTCQVRVRADVEYRPPRVQPRLGSTGIAAFEDLGRVLEEGALQSAVRNLVRHAKKRREQG